MKTSAELDVIFSLMQSKDFNNIQRRCDLGRLTVRFFERHGIPSPFSADTSLEAFESALIDLEARLRPRQEDDGA